MERSILISLVAFLLFSVLENVISTVVGPTLIFYILSVGGTNEDYGLTMSAASLGMTLMMFYFGKWVDRNGNKYQAPLSFAFILGIIGSIAYFLASILPSGWGINAILFGRFVQGMGGAGKTLTRSWIATAVPLEQQKTIFSVLAIVGIAGQAIGPLMNTLVAEIDFSVPITPTYSININSYNAVGLLVALNEVLLWIIVALFVKDPPPRKKEKALASATEAEAAVSEAGLYDILNAMTHFDIFFPLIQRFVIVANFTLYGVVIAPVGASMLNWSPVNISTLSAVVSGFMFVGMGLTLYLSLIKTSDFVMILIGDAIFVISGALTYFSWRGDTATALSFSIPIILTFIVYPFAGPGETYIFVCICVALSLQL